MTIIGLDSSGIVASAAIVTDDVLVAEITMEYKKTHSETLVPMLDEIVKTSNTDLKDIDAIAIAAGPGSFTGLRIGSATAKGLAYALNKPIVSVPTTAGLAYNFFGSIEIICPIMDARRNQVYTGIYTFENDRLLTLYDQHPLDIEELTDKLNKEYQGKRVIFLGDGVSKYKDTINEKLELTHIFAPANLNKQHAASVAVLGGKLYSEGKTETAFDHAPVYLRLSQAERERKEKMEHGGT